MYMWFKVIYHQYRHPIMATIKYMNKLETDIIETEPRVCFFDYDNLVNVKNV